MQENHENVAEVVRSEERLRVEATAVPVERVRLERHVVTETRTIEVRREELRVVREPVGSAPTPSATGRAPVLVPLQPHLEIVLHEEEVVTRVVPRERVRVYVDSTTTTEAVHAALSSEVVVVDDVVPAAGA